MHRALHLNEIFIPFSYILELVNLFWHAIMLVKNVNMETGKIIAIKKETNLKTRNEKFFLEKITNMST